MLLRVKSKNLLPTVSSWRFSPIKTVLVLSFMLSVIHFNLNLYKIGDSGWGSFFFFFFKPMGFQVLQLHVLKSLFFHCIIFASLSKVSRAYLHVHISGFSVPSIYVSICQYLIVLINIGRIILGRVILLTLFFTVKIIVAIRGFYLYIGIFEKSCISMSTVSVFVLGSW